ncbi:MAG: hypothetical protein K5978_06815 [Campylobacter sp.]|nr:hypothetical protein [Campylobacter sp.]
MKVKEFLVDFLASRGKVDVNFDDDISKEGILDSFSIMVLFMEIQSKFGIRVSPTEMLQLRSLTQIQNFIESKK